MAAWQMPGGLVVQFGGPDRVALGFGWVPALPEPAEQPEAVNPDPAPLPERSAQKRKAPRDDTAGAK